MLGKMPAVTALTAVFTVVAGALPCAAQGASSTAQAAEAEASRFNAWRDRFRATALKEGIPHDVFEKALGGVRPDPTVHEKNEDQPEFTRPVWEYLDGALSDSRIRNGRKMLRRHASLLEKAERKWGVPRHVLVAIWGMETSYGALLGKHNVFEALATLSYRGDRTGYGEQQLLAALRLLADGHKPAEAMKGSWAGAVGHTQFVPTTYLKYAVDGDKDGRRDLWDSLSDVFHSTAHYLKKSGFDPNLKWGREAFLPDDFDYALAGYDITKTLGEWRELGIRMANGSLVPDMDIKASVLVPAGHRGPAFLIYENFHAILAYNHSTSYALAIGLLSDRLRGGPSLKTEWPRHVQPLRRAERLEIQRRLKALGYEVTKVDGVLGRETRKAIRAFQKDRGEVADGYATPDLLAALRSAGPAETASAEPAAEDGTTDGQDAPQAAETAMMDASEAGPEGAAAGAGSDADRAEGVAQTAAEEPLAVAAADETAAGPAGEETVTEPGANESVTEPGANESVTEAAADETAAEAEPTPAAAASETPAETAETDGTPLPRAKPVAVASEPESAPGGESAPGEETMPRPRAKPVAAASPSAQQAAGVPSRAGPKPGGVTSAMAAPGLKILRQGMAMPVRGRPAVKTSASGETAEPAPLNNGGEPIVSPPGVTYVGSEAGSDGGENASDEKDVSEKPGTAPDPGS